MIHYFNKPIRIILKIRGVTAHTALLNGTPKQYLFIKIYPSYYTIIIIY